MSAHTPGPWRARGHKVYPSDGYARELGFPDGNLFLASVSMPPLPDGGPLAPAEAEAAANARLMAAAPTMLLALETVLNHLEFDRELVEATISEARGERTFG